MGVILDYPNEAEELAAAFRRRDELKDLAEAMAQLRYRATAIWLGSQLLPWGLLTDGQRKGYIEAELKTIRGF